MDMLFLIPLAMTAIFYVAMWYFRIGSNKMKERNVKDLVIGLAAFLALIPLHLLIGPLPTPHRAPYAIDAIEAAAAAMALGGVVTWFTGRRRASWFFMMAFVTVTSVRSISEGSGGQWWFGVITLAAVAGGLILRRWRALDNYYR